MLNALRSADGASAMLIGHNPSTAQFGREILSEPYDHPEFWRWPTAATLVCDLPGDRWKAAELGTGTAVDFVIPRELD